MSNKQIITNIKIYAFLLYQLMNVVLGTVFIPFIMGFIYLTRKMDGNMIRLIIKTSYLASFRMLELSVWATETLYFQSFKDFVSWQKWKQWEITEEITKSYRAAH